MPGSLYVIAIIGSLRQRSYTRRLTEAYIALAPNRMKIEVVPIGGLSLYNQDLDPSPPDPWVKFRNRIKAADGVLFATPEYNRSVPGVLKNAIDVGSRPYGQSAWTGKPAAVLSCTPGSLGAFGANHHLRQSLVFLDMPTLQQPEIYISHVDKLFDASGYLAEAKDKELATQFLAAFEAWMLRQNAPRAAVRG